MTWKKEERESDFQYITERYNHFLHSTDAATKNPNILFAVLQNEELMFSV